MLLWLPVLQAPPIVALLPVGTGNDLARILGWGPGYTGGDQVEEMSKILTAVENGQPSILDRYSGEY